MKMKRNEIVELAINYNQYLIDFAQRLTTNEEMAKDSVQDAYLQLLKMPSLEEMEVNTKKFCGFLRQLVVWQIRRNYSKSKRKDTCYLDAIEEWERPKSMKVEDQAFNLRELRQVIEAAIIDTVPEWCQQTARLRYLNDLSWKEIGDILGIPFATAQVRCSKYGKGVRTAVQAYLAI